MDHMHMGNIHFEIDWMMLYMAFFMFLLGTVMGSFFDCIAVRRARNESVVKGRSHCDTCGHALGAREMIPLVNYAINKGKCRYCGTRIPWDAFYAELAGGIIFAGMMVSIDISLYLPMWVVFGALLLLISLIDYNQKMIPNFLLFLLAANRLLAHFIIVRDPWPMLPEMFLGACSVSVPLLVLVLIMDKVLGKETMGGGDIKLLFVIGLYMSWIQMILILFLACILGIMGALIARKSVDHKSPEIVSENPESEAVKNRNTKPDNAPPMESISFGPFIASAAILVFWFGQPLINWYLSFFSNIA